MGFDMLQNVRRKTKCSNRLATTLLLDSALLQNPVAKLRDVLGLMATDSSAKPLGSIVAMSSKCRSGRVTRHPEVGLFGVN